MYLIGIDLGGTKVEGVVIDPEKISEPLARLRHPTESVHGYEHVLGQIGKVVADLRAAFPGEFPNRIGIGTPGTLDPKTGLLRGSNTQCLNGRPLAADLEKALGMRVEIENDANCFALAEATLGAGRGYPTVFGIIMGTGCGGGYVVDGRVLHGCHGVAGEWGQIVLDPAGPVSGYGTRGIIEVYIAGPALEKYYEEQAGTRRPLKEIAARVGEDPAAAATLDRLQEYFSRSLAFIVNTFDPHAIVIGGGVGNLDILYSDATRARISENIFAPTFEAVMRKPQLGDSAGVFGAAMLCA